MCDPEFTETPDTYRRNSQLTHAARSVSWFVRPHNGLMAMDTTFLSDSGKAYFCLKVADSRRQGWRLEQRFDKLFEALEILCRYIENSEPSMASKVAVALTCIASAEMRRLDAIFADEGLASSLKDLAERLIAGLEYEANSSEYASDHLSHIRRAQNYYRTNVSDFEQCRIANPENAAAALLRFFVTLRNSRFHAYAGASGSIIGHERPLEPICNAFETVLLLIAAGRFGITPESLASIVVSPAVDASQFVSWLKHEKSA